MFHSNRNISGHASSIYALASDSRYIYSASADRHIARWRIDTGLQDPFSIRFDYPVYALSLLNHNAFLVAGLNNGNVHVFDLEKRIEIKYFKQHSQAIFCITENERLNHFYVTDAGGTISVWNSTTLELLISIPMNCGKIRRISISSDGEFFACACEDGYVRIFDTITFNEQHTFFAHKDGVSSVLIHPLNGKLLFTGGKDAMLRLWNLNSDMMLEEKPAHHFVVYDLIAVHEGEYIVSASRDKTIKIWKSQDCSFIERLDLKTKGHKHSVNCLIKMSESSFASGSDDSKIICWEATIKRAVESHY